MRLILLAIFVCLTGLVGTTNTSPVFAQGLGALLDGPAPNAAATQDAARIAEIMRQAKENGVSVVVIGQDGQIVTPVSSPAAAGGDAAAGAAAVDTSRLMRLQDEILKFRTALIERLLGLPNAFNEVAYILRATSPDGTIWAFGRVLLISCGLFAAGIVFERFVYGQRIARSMVMGRIRDHPVGYREKMPFLAFRFLMGLIGVVVSMIVAYVLGVIVFGPLEDQAIQFTVAAINGAYFFSRVVAILWRMVLSPYLDQYRIPIMDTRDARRLHNWLWILGSFDVCSIIFGIWIGELGLNYEVYAFLASLLSFIVVLMNILMVLVNRRAITRAFRNGKPVEEISWITKVISNIWAPLVIIYVIFAWFELTYDLVLGNPSSIPLIAGAYGIILSIIVVYGLISYFIERGFARARAMRLMNEQALAELQDSGALEDLPDPQQAAAEEAAKARLAMNRPKLNTFEDLARRVAGILAFVAGVYAFFFIWDNNSAQMVETLADRLLDVMVILFIGYIVYHTFRIWIDSKIAEEQGEMPEEELGDEGSAHSSASRLATLLPLFRNFILIVVMVTILLIVLMQMGINVGPLFAGAGVVGVAVGFGSQALVRDIFSGGFFLFDDAFRKGEYLDVGGVKGTVEKISVRSFQLRHHLGALHTIPFGEIQVMTNYSRDWVIMKLPLRVTYDTDVEKVRKLIKKLGIDLLNDPEIGQNFIQPLKSQGVIEMQDSAMIIRVKFMTKPGDQWLVRKKVYEDIRVLFEREGIRFAHKEVTVRLADGKVEKLTDEERKAVSAAARAAIDEEAMQGGVEDDGDDR